MKKIFLSLFFLPLISNGIVLAAGSVCGLVSPPSGICSEIETMKKGKYEPAQAAATAETEPTRKAALQVAADKIRTDIIMKEIEALSERTAAWKATEGLQVGNEGSLSLIKIENQGGTWIPDKIIKLMAQIIGTFAILILAFGGLLMITSEGDENRLQNGKNIFFYTIVGLVVAFLSYIGVQFIISVLFTTGGA